MLETCEFQKKKETVYRLACLIPYKSIQNRLTELGLSATPVNVDKITKLLNRLSVPSTIEEVIDDAFQPKANEVTPFPESRFSDGTIGVYYSAIEVTTCKREIEYHLRIQIAENGSEEINYTRTYQLIKCNYSGTTVDLRGHKKIHNELISQDKSGYGFCQALGLEAKQFDIDGFFTPSAREVGGTCVPVFVRSALSQSSIEFEVNLTFSYVDMKFQNS